VERGRETHRRCRELSCGAFCSEKGAGAERDSKGQLPAAAPPLNTCSAPHPTLNSGTHPTSNSGTHPTPPHL